LENQVGWFGGGALFGAKRLAFRTLKGGFRPCSGENKTRALKRPELFGFHLLNFRKLKRGAAQKEKWRDGRDSNPIYRYMLSR
jgi:hypothetical protein